MVVQAVRGRTRPEPGSALARSPARVPAGVAPVAGAGAVRVARVRGRDAVVSARARSPLVVLALRPEAPARAAWLVTSTLGGGLVDGDAIALEVAVEPGARALVTSQASTKIYRGERGAESCVRAEVGQGGLLALVPDPVSAFAGARYRQSISVTLAPGASLALCDVITAGRVASGERWRAARVASRIDVQGGEDGAGWRLTDAIELDAVHGEVARRMGRFDVLATLVLAGPLLGDAQSRILARVGAAPIGPGPVIESATQRSDALVLRLAATHVEAAVARLRGHLAEVFALVGDPLCRKR